MSFFGLAKAAATGANPWTALGELLLKPLLILALVAAVLGYVHHHGRAGGKADQAAADQVTIDDANRRGNTAIEANTRIARENTELRAAADAQMREWERLDREGADALAAAEAQHAKDQADAEAWRRRNAPILATDSCRAAKAQLQRACPVKEY